ncbi:hypothetical protein PV327_008414 [Microctonus hyperodae]|uniref:Serpin domain-containing protein n=1 Tax=Microctonus hyperodae TaxID=165561 RepID=A0AA39F326_MICHY|nr:hypothetical protein PV327_008414 [Microctonus hyperodae]
MNFQLSKFILTIVISIYHIGNLPTMATQEDNSPSELQNVEALRSVSTGLNKFAAEFYKQTSDNLESNLICSPLSAGAVLSMTAHGAAGNTEQQMRTSLHLPNDRAIGLRGFQSLFETLNSVTNVQLSLANKIFVSKDLEVKDNFLNVTANSFKSGVENLDFTNTQVASKKINNWCEEKTKNLIKDVIKPDDLIDAAMVLVNAVYFKGTWEKKFDPSNTFNKTFYINENTTHDVLMMRQRNKLNYGELSELDAIFVELPYKSENENDSTSMFIICPNQINGLEKAQNNIEKIDFKQLHDQHQMTEIRLFMPKFKIESTMDLKPVLKKMGMTDMFNNADFSEISNTPLSVAKVIQKAFIEVNEEGSEAAAITAAIHMVRTSAFLRPEPLELSIDRPFIYAIYHAPTNSILFQGHILQLPA